MTISRALLATNLAIAHVNSLQLEPVRAAVLDKDKSDHFVDWKLCDNELSPNNLGGLGPNNADTDPHEMRLPNAATVGGQALDLVATLDDSSNYAANNIGVNRVDNCFGHLNVQASHSAKLNFKFTKHGETTAWEPEERETINFKFTIFDIDESRKVTEKIVFDTPVNHLYRSEESEWLVAGSNTAASPLEIESTMRGGGSDNPRDGPLQLNTNQTRRSVMVQYVGKTQWSITFEAMGSGNGGRNFLYAGESNTPNAEACEDWIYPTFNWQICKSEVKHNNLGGQGPLKDSNAPEEILYTSVATLHGQALDLRVTADEEYTAHNVSRNTVINATDHRDASIHGCFGAINVKAASKVTLTFSFLNQTSGEVMEFGHMDPGFGFTVYDLDQEEGLEERVHFITPFYLPPVVGPKVKRVDGEDQSFHSTVFGNGADNALTEEDLDKEEQKDRAVRALYHDATWKVTFDVQGGVEGRNFLFGGCINK